MAVSRMLRIQILGHASIAGPLKAYLREAGVVEVTDASVPGFACRACEDDGERYARLIEKTDGAIQFLDRFAPRLTLREKLASGPMEVAPAEIERMLREVDVESTAARCQELEAAMRRCRDEIAWSRDLAREMERWTALGAPLDRLATARCETQLWSFPEASAAALASLFDERPGAILEIVSRFGGRIRVAVVALREETDSLAEALKEAQGIRFGVEKLAGTPAAIVEGERRRAAELEAELARAEEQARGLTALLPSLRVLSDHFRDSRSLVEVERHVHRTERVFLLEGWIPLSARRRVEKEIPRRFREVEVLFREPVEGEDPPVELENRAAVRPFEFIMTLYGRPRYGEIDPTPLFTPWFLLCFALCMGDAGYGLVLATASWLMIYKVGVRGGTRSLMQLLFAGSVMTIVAGVLMGGYFGIDASRIPAPLKRVVVISPMDNPMGMLNVAFLIGFAHILFGIGVRMVAHFRSGDRLAAIFDDLGWIVFLIALAPPIFGGILGGSVPPDLMRFCLRAALAIAAILFVAGARKERNKLLGGFKSLLGFYSITGYFSDVLSYARLLALGLASGAIAVAINGIAQMVSGLPYYIGYVAAVLVLLGGHAFNLAINVLGAFVHSARLQYLEFFNKFFTGGGREFRPFRSERQYTVLKRTEG